MLNKNNFKSNQSNTNRPNAPISVERLRASELGLIKWETILTQQISTQKNLREHQIAGWLRNITLLILRNKLSSVGTRTGVAKG